MRRTVPKTSDRPCGATPVSDTGFGRSHHGVSTVLGPVSQKRSFLNTDTLLCGIPQGEGVSVLEHVTGQSCGAPVPRLPSPTWWFSVRGSVTEDRARRRHRTGCYGQGWSALRSSCTE